MSSLTPSYSSSQHHPGFTLPDSRRWPSRTRASGRFKSVQGSAKVSNGLLIAMVVVALVGLGLATYLSWVALTSSQVAGCGGGQIFDCRHVLHSKWSKVLGIPVGVPAAALYLVTLTSLSVALLNNGERVRKFALGVVSIAALSAGLAALWFITLQLFVVEHLCSYCLAAHVCGLILAGVVLWKCPFGLRPTMSFAGIGLAGVVMLASAQILAEEPKSFEIIEHPVAPPSISSDPDPASIEQDNLFSAPGFDDKAEKPAPSDSSVFEAPVDSDPSKQSTKRKSRGSDSLTLSLLQFFQLNSAMISIQETNGEAGESRQQENLTENNRQEERKLISISGGKVQLDVEQWPLVGSTVAKHTFVEMFDYTCPHCRANHQFVKAALDQLDKEVAMIALAVPMNTQCNSTLTVNDPLHRDACELARLSVAVWRVDPSKFAEFHNWLFEGDSAPAATDARAFADKLVDAQKLETEITSDVPGQYVTKQVELYKTIGAGTVPKLLFPGSSLNGTVDSTEALLKIIEQQKAGQR